MDKAIITQVDEESKESTPIGDSQPREPNINIIGYGVKT